MLVAKVFPRLYRCPHREILLYSTIFYSIIPLMLTFETFRRGRHLCNHAAFSNIVKEYLETLTLMGLICEFLKI